jgi:hypothetical protein
LIVSFHPVVKWTLQHPTHTRTQLRYKVWFFKQPHKWKTKINVNETKR